MKNQPLRTFGVAALVAQCLVLFACSSSSPGTGGQGGSTGQGGAVGGDGGPLLYGSCDGVTENPDIAVGSACTADCASVGCTTPATGPKCHADCCVTCGIDQLGAKMCQCPNVGFAYTNCTCAPPSSFPTLLHGGPCEPQGDSKAIPTSGPSLKGVPCTKPDVVCFTSDSIPTSERGCICLTDSPGVSTMHCGAVNHWFIDDFVTTTYN